MDCPERAVRVHVRNQPDHASGRRYDFPLSGAHGIAAGPDGAIWFTEGNPAALVGPNGVDRIGRITTEA
jgi:streptogramin lyase